MKQDAIWDYYQNEDLNVFKDALPRLKYILDKVKGKKVLNIGIGSGEFEKLAMSRDFEVYCLDPSEKAISNIKEHLGDRAYVGYIQELPFEDSMFDSVIASEVLEHLDPVIMSRGVKEIFRVLKPGGNFLMTVPANENLEDSMVVCPCGKRFHKVGHVQSFTKEKILQIFKNEGRVESLSEHLFPNWKELNWKGKIVNLLKEVLLVLNSNVSGTTYFCNIKKI